MDVDQRCGSGGLLLALSISIDRRQTSCAKFVQGMDQVSQTHKSYLGREHRIRVRFEAVLTEPDGCQVRVQVLDVSSSGFRILSNAELTLDEEVTLGIARSHPLRARICWTRGQEAGGIFLDSVRSIV